MKFRYVRISYMIEPIINAPTFQLPLIMVAGMILPLDFGVCYLSDR